MLEVEIAWLQVGLGVVAWMVCGMIWYNPKVMGTMWMKLTGFSEEMLNEKIESGEFSMGLAMGSSAFAGLVMSFCLAALVSIGNDAGVAPMWIGLLCSVGFIMTDVGAHGFEGRTWKLYLIDKGWMVDAILITAALHQFL